MSSEEEEPTGQWKPLLGDEWSPATGWVAFKCQGGNNPTTTEPIPFVQLLGMSHVTEWKHHPPRAHFRLVV